MESLPYRRNPYRARSPQVFAAPHFDALLHGKLPVPPASRKGFAECLDQLTRLYPYVADHRPLDAYHFYCGFEIATLWSASPTEPDIFLLLGPNDFRQTYWPLVMQFRQSRDVRLLQDFAPLSYFTVV